MLTEIFTWERIQRRWLVLTLLLCTGTFGCRTQEDAADAKYPIQINNTMITKPFYNVDQVPQSPEPPSPMWRGILIQSEASHKLGMKQRMVVIHGYYKINGSEYPLNDDDLRIHAVNTSTGIAFDSSAGEKDDSPVEPEEPGPPLSRDDIRSMIFSGYFNTDIVLTLGLPLVSAKYRVWTSMGPIKSNELLIEISAR